MASGDTGTTVIVKPAPFFGAIFPICGTLPGGNKGGSDEVKFMREMGCAAPVPLGPAFAIIPTSATTGTPFKYVEA